MEEKKFVQLKKDEYYIREFVKKEFGKGKISFIKIEYTPVGEKIIIATSRPGFIIGKRGERINEITDILRRKFKLENPHLEILEITKPEFDAQNIADEIALSLERFGSLKFKVVAYRMLERIIRAGALGVEIRLSGKLPSERAKSWRFANGYLKKTGDTVKIVNKAEARANLLLGTIGIKVSILPPDVEIHDRITITPENIARVELNKQAVQVIEEKPKKPRKKKVKASILESENKNNKSTSQSAREAK
ncbi:MAG: 30S ribosomal protein S3 [Candidatus Pacearchaeota archaeon]|nr:30S ribosomal protein S3 [Candidatus Pacearchaeota archaeon]